MSVDRGEDGKSLKKIVFLSHTTIMNAHRLVEKVMLKRQQGNGGGVVGGAQRTENTKDLLTIQQNLEQAIGDIDHLLSVMDHGYTLADSAPPTTSSRPGMGGSSAATPDEEVTDE